MNTPHLTPPEHLGPPDHLTAAHFAACLTGEDVAPATHAHLAGCEPCRAELATFLDRINGFSVAAMAWTQTQPAPSPRAIASRKPRRSFAAAPQWAIAALVALVLGTPLGLRELHHRAEFDTATAVNADTADQIAQDNQLLQQVNLAVATNEPSPLSEYHLQDGSGKPSGTMNAGTKSE